MTLIFGFKFKFSDLLTKYTKRLTYKANNLQHYTVGEIQFAIHSGDSAEFGKSHLEQWIPVFIKSNIPFLILVRNLPLYSYCTRQWPGTPCAYAKSVEDIDKALKYLPNNGKVFYLSNTGNSSSVLRRNDFHHIFLGHGDSNKFASAHKFFRVYDELWVASDAHIDRFKNANFETRHILFRKIGRPMLKKLIYLNRMKDWKERVPKIALYAPTWEGVEDINNGSSVKISKDILHTLLAYGFDVRIKFHPATGKRIPSYLEIEKEIQKIAFKNKGKVFFYPKETSLYKLMNNCTLCIGDNSAVITDFLSCNCPIAIFKTTEHVIVSKAEIAYEDFCYEWSTLQEFEIIVKEISEGHDTKNKNRKAAEKYYLGLNETMSGSFYQMLKK